MSEPKVSLKKAKKERKPKTPGKKREKKKKQKITQTQSQSITVNVAGGGGGRRGGGGGRRGGGGGGGGGGGYGKLMPQLFAANQQLLAGILSQPPRQQQPPAQASAGAPATNPVVGAAVVPETPQQLDQEAASVRMSAMERRRALNRGQERGASIFGLGGLLGPATRPEVSEISKASTSTTSVIGGTRPYSSKKVVKTDELLAQQEGTRASIEKAVAKQYEEKPISEGSAMLKPATFIRPPKFAPDLFGSLDSNVFRAMPSAGTEEIPAADWGTSFNGGIASSPAPDQVEEVEEVEEVEDVPEAAAGAAGWTPPPLPDIRGTDLSASVLARRARSAWENHYDLLTPQNRALIKRTFEEGESSGENYDALRIFLRRFENRKAKKAGKS